MTSTVVQYNPLWHWSLIVSASFIMDFSGYRCGWPSINIQKCICNNIIIRNICDTWKKLLNILLTCIWNNNISDNWRNFVINWRVFQQFEFHHFQQAIFYLYDYSCCKIRIHHYMCFVYYCLSWKYLTIIQNFPK